MKGHIDIVLTIILLGIVVAGLWHMYVLMVLR